MIRFAILGNFFYVCLDVISKYFLDTRSMPIFQYFSIHSFIGIITTLTFLKFKGKLHILKTKKRKLHIFRALSVSLVDGLIIYSLKFVPLVDIYPMIFTMPFFLIILSRIFLKEKASNTMIIALVAGFVGVMIALNPTGEFKYALLMPLFATFMQAINYLIVKKYGTDEHSITYSFYTLIALFLISLIPSLMDNIAIKPIDMLFLPLASLFYLMAIGFSVAAFKSGRTDIVSSFQYSQILWGIILGFLIFGEIPTINVLFGAALIILSGIYIIFNKNKL